MCATDAPAGSGHHSGLAVEEGNYYANNLASRHFEYEFNLAKIGRPVDKEEWRSGPPVVDISRCLDAAREAGFLRRGHAGERIASKDGS